MGITWNKPRPVPVEPEAGSCASITYICDWRCWEVKRRIAFFVTLENFHRRLWEVRCGQCLCDGVFSGTFRVRCVFCNLSSTEMELFAITLLSLWVQTQVVVEYKSATSFEGWFWQRVNSLTYHCQLASMDMKAWLVHNCSNEVRGSLQVSKQSFTSTPSVTDISMMGLFWQFFSTSFITK